MWFSIILKKLIDEKVDKYKIQCRGHELLIQINNWFTEQNVNIYKCGLTKYLLVIKQKNFVAYSFLMGWIYFDYKKEKVKK